jgi:hypothetical protein
MGSAGTPHGGQRPNDFQKELDVLHWLHTNLAVVKGSATIGMKHWSRLDDEKKHELFREISSAARLAIEASIDLEEMIRSHEAEDPP